MSEVSNQTVINAGSPYLGGRVKGDFSNRLDCAIDKTKNNLKYLAQDTLVLGGTAASLYGLKKSTKVSDYIGKAVQKAANWVAKKLPKNKIGAFGDKVAKLLEKVPNKYKAAGVALTVATGFLFGIAKKRTYNKGRIEQQYQDQAIVDRHQKIHLGL